MRICIYGAGAMGTSLGALLAKAGTPCDLVTRDAAHVEALNTSGARIGNEPAVPVRALLPEEMSGEYDLIFLAAKQRENERISRFLPAYLAENGALVTVQNGFPEPELAKFFGDRVYGCALSWGAEKTGDGKISVTSKAGYHFALGAFGSGLRLTEIAKLLGKVGTVTTGNLTELRFAKLATNVSLSTLSAISGLTFGELASRHRRRVLALIRETFSVARAYGCRHLPLNGHDLYKVFGAFGYFTLPIAVKPYRNTSSGMLKDIRAGKRCDVDFVAGAVLRMGREKGIDCPALERAVALVHDVENGLAELAPETIKLL